MGEEILLLRENVAFELDFERQRDVHVLGEHPRHKEHVCRRMKCMSRKHQIALCGSSAEKEKINGK